MFDSFLSLPNPALTRMPSTAPSSPSSSPPPASWRGKIDGHQSKFHPTVCDKHQKYGARGTLSEDHTFSNWLTRELHKLKQERALHLHTLVKELESFALFSPPVTPPSTPNEPERDQASCAYGSVMSADVKGKDIINLTCNVGFRSSTSSNRPKR